MARAIAWFGTMVSSKHSNAMCVALNPIFSNVFFTSHLSFKQRSWQSEFHDRQRVAHLASYDANLLALDTCFSWFHANTARIRYIFPDYLYRRIVPPPPTATTSSAVLPQTPLRDCVVPAAIADQALPS